MDINIKFTERAYGGKKFRPNTHIHYEKVNHLLLCITCWGKSGILDRIVEVIKNSMTLSDQDSEVTTLSAPQENLHQSVNALKMAVTTANQNIYNQFNKEEYTAGFEIFVAVQEGPQWIYVSYGQPSLTLYREKMGAIPLRQNIDMNILSLQSCLNDPLPNQLLGLSPYPPSLHLGNIYLKPSDRLVLVSRTYVPGSFFSLPQDQFNEVEISRLLARDNKDIPFWLGFIRVH